MAEDLNLETKLKSSADTKGAEQMGGALDGLKTKAEELKAAFIELFAMAEIAAFFKDATEEAYNTEKALRGVAQAALIVGEDMGTAKEEALHFTEALAIQTGVIKTDLLDAYAKVYLATGSVTEAQKESTLAANVAAVRHIDLASALRLVEAAATGVPGRFDKIIGGVTTGTTAMEKHESMTRRLVGTYGDVSKVTDDAAMSLDRANRRWDQFKETVGGPVLKATAAVKDSLTFLPQLFAEIADRAVIYFQSIGRNAQALANLMSNLTHPIAAWKSYQAERLADQVITDHALTESHEQAVVRQAAADRTARVAAVKELDFRGKDEVEARAKTLGSLKEMEEAYLVWLDAKTKDRAAKIRAGEQLIRDDAAKEILDFQKKELKKIEIEEQTRKVTEGILKKVLDAKAQELADELNLEEQCAKQELEIKMKLASGAISIGDSLFGNAKEWAIGKAVISTYEGAAKSIAEWGAPWGAIFAALAIAEGLAEVAKIESTPAPKTSTGAIGFDDPSNDYAAYQGGRKWANDMIGKFSGGASSVSRGWAGGVGATTTNDNRSTTTNINVTGLVSPSDKEQLKVLARKLALATQSDSQRTIARRT